MAPEPKSPRKRASKKAASENTDATSVDTEKKSRKKAVPTAVATPIFQAAPVATSKSSINQENEDNKDNKVKKNQKAPKEKESSQKDKPQDNFEDDDYEKMKNDFEKTKKEDNKYVKPNERKTKPFLFEFERVRILGERATQISMGAKPMIKNVDNLDPKIVAKMELENKVIPLIIIRELPNGLMEKWKISELNF